MKIFANVIMALFLLALTASAQTATPQFSTWVQATGTVNQTNVLGANQVMEILSVAADETVGIEVSANGQTVSFGRRARDLGFPPSPLIIAGPATVTFFRISSGGVGGIISYRISEKTGGR